MNDERQDDAGRDGARREVDGAAVVETVRELVEELEPGSGRAERVRLDASLDDLGLDSLSRAQLVERLEERFGVALPDSAFTDAESPRALLREVRRASPRHGDADGEGVDAETAETAGSLEERGRRRQDRGGVRAPQEAGTLLEVLEHHAAEHPDRSHVLFLERGPGEGPEHDLTYGDLDRRSAAAAAALQDLGLEPGGNVALMLPSGLEYFVAFFAVLRAGGVPVSLYPPVRRSQIEDHLKRQAGILENAEARALITFDEVKPLARLVEARVPSLRRVLTPADLEGGSGRPQEVRVGPDDTAFIQYTSGSTGNPKGVVLSHDNLLSNLRSMSDVLDLGGDDVVVSWLPLYHDMGLIGAWMGSLYYGMHLVLMSPLSFLSRPARWLRAVHRHGGTLSAAPNFAYELCLSKVGDDELEGLDLSTWRAALNGAEPVSPRAVERFPERFAPYGFAPETMMPVFGLAENSLAVTFTPPERPPRIDGVQRELFQAERRAVPAEGDDAGALRFVSCGRPIPGTEVRIVDEDGQELGERREGRLQFRGPSATRGYLRNPEATERLVQGDWLDSQDLAYRADGEIYLTGRAKDVIIRAGRNIHPQEVEDAVGDLDGVRRGCVAVFAAAAEDEGTERLVVVAETRLDDEEARRELRGRVERTALDLVGTHPDDVVLAAPRTVPKTSSGKIRRSEARELYEAGELEAGPRAVWLQVVRLALSGGRSWLAGLGGRLAHRAYAAWFWGVFALTGAVVWPLLWLVPTLGLRRRLVAAASRAASALTATRVRVRGRERFASGGPWVIVANHASYLDAFALAHAIPPDTAFVAKGEFRESFVIRHFLHRIGSLLVDLSDPAEGRESSERGEEVLARGHNLAIYPEGRVRRAPGLGPFRTGAFVVAARAGTPVVPVVLRGTRAKMPGGSWAPRPGGVAVEVLAPVAPEGGEWSHALVLRRTVREAMEEALSGS